VRAFGSAVEMHSPPGTDADPGKDLGGPGETPENRMKPRRSRERRATGTPGGQDGQVVGSAADSSRVTGSRAIGVLGCATRRGPSISYMEGPRCYLLWRIMPLAASIDTRRNRGSAAEHDGDGGRVTAVTPPVDRDVDEAVDRAGTQGITAASPVDRQRIPRSPAQSSCARPRPGSRNALATEFGYRHGGDPGNGGGAGRPDPRAGIQVGGARQPVVGRATGGRATGRRRLQGRAKAPPSHTWRGLRSCLGGISSALADPGVPSPNGAMRRPPATSRRRIAHNA
jgi:hypothetical protein